MTNVGGFVRVLAVIVFPRQEITEMKKPSKKMRNLTENCCPKKGEQGANVNACINTLFLRQ